MSRRTIAEILATGERLFSSEFFPARTDEGERQLWQALRQLEALKPSFVSVTYGAGGSTRDRTVAMTERIVQPDEAGRLASGLPDLAGMLILGAARGRERCPFHQLPCFRLRAGDVIVYLTGEDRCVEDAEPVSPEEIGAPSA